MLSILASGQVVVKKKNRGYTTRKVKYKPRKLESHSYSVQSIDRAFEVLRCFTFERPRLTLGELKELVTLSKTTLFRILQALAENRVISYDPSSNKYSLGIRLFELGEIAVSSTSLRQKAGPFLDMLEAESRYPALVGILEEGELVYIDGRPGKEPIPLFGTRHGKRQAPHLGSVGKTLMAYLTEAEVDDLLARHPLQRFTPRSVTDPERFKEGLSEARKQGYGQDEGELVEGVIGIAAPIRDHSGKVIAAVGIVFSAFKADKRKRERMIGLVTEAARNISEAMGYAYSMQPAK